MPSLVNVFEPDILIISINMRKQFSQLKGIENHFEPDIKIKIEKDLITIHKVQMNLMVTVNSGGSSIQKSIL